MVSSRVASAPSAMRTATTCPSSALPAQATAGAATKMAPGLRALPPGESWTARVGGRRSNRQGEKGPRAGATESQGGGKIDCSPSWVRDEAVALSCCCPFAAPTLTEPEEMIFSGVDMLKGKKPWD